MKVKPVSWVEVCHVWGCVVLGVLVFLIMTGIPWSFRGRWC